MVRVSAKALLAGVVINDRTGTGGRAVLAVTGDLYPGGRCEEYFKDGRAEDICGDVIKEFKTTDLRISDLECPLTRNRTPIVKSGPHLVADPECIKGIRQMGIDVVTLANNHIMDMGERGFHDTITLCQEYGLKPVGAGSDHQEACKPLKVRINGLNIVIFNMTEHEFSIADEHKPGAWHLDAAENYRAIQQGKAQGDFVLIVLHGGNEYNPFPSPWKVRLCHYLADIGANAIVCHHIHVPSGIEVYHGVPIVYSTGNFLFDLSGNRPAEWYHGYMVMLSVRRDMVESIRLVPYVQCYENPGIRVMKKEEALTFMRSIADLSHVISDPVACKKKWLKKTRSMEIHYLSTLFALSRLERFFLRLGIWPFWRVREKRILDIINLFTCDSHREVMVSILSDIKAKLR
jgi:poly-gamma-glutamate synthesis protein (capsule biosynthesis protein)